MIRLKTKAKIINFLNTFKGHPSFHYLIVKAQGLYFRDYFRDSP